MKLIKDLGVEKRVTKTGNTTSKRYGIYECPICKTHFKTVTSGVKNGRSTKCVSCANTIKKTIHGRSKSLLYTKWANMKHRCYSIKYKKYCDYGGRGITVCNEWLNDFVAYENYILSLPNANEPGYSIDRIDNNGNYEPGNVRWTTPQVQANNRRIPKHNTSGYLGVKQNKKGKWEATIARNRKNYFLGSFVELKDAVRARELAEIKFKDKL